MSAVKHTLGPLSLDPEEHSIKIRDAAGVMVAQVHQYSRSHGPTREYCERYAAVFVASPELLAVLHDVREFIDGQIDVVDGSYGEPEPNRAMLLAREIDAVLAKAEGGAS